jgi:NADH-quinone oxidoreductase subunit H
LLPANLIWILALAGLRVTEDWNGRDRFLTIGAAALVLLVIIAFWPSRAQPDQATPTPSEGRVGGVDGYPLPPMDLQVPPSPRLKRIEAERTPVPAADRDGADE